MKIKIFLSITFASCLFLSCHQSNEVLYQQANSLINEKRFSDAIKIYSEILHDNNKMQKAFYKRGYCHLRLKEYSDALKDLNTAIALKKIGEFIYTANDESPVAAEEDHYQVVYGQIMYQRALVKFYMDSLQESYSDFQVSIANFYEISSCYLWLGNIQLQLNKQKSACELFSKAQKFANTKEDQMDAEKLISSNCN